MECRCSRWPWPQLREFWHPLSSGSCFLPILNWAARTSVLALAPADLLLPPSSSLVQRILLVQALTHLRSHRVTRFPHLFSTEATLIVAGVSYHLPVLFPEKKSLRVFVCLFVTLIFGDRIFLYSPGCSGTALWTRLALNSRKSTYLCLLSWTKGVHHHCPAKSVWQFSSIILWDIWLS